MELPGALGDDEAEADGPGADAGSLPSVVELVAAFRAGVRSPVELVDALERRSAAVEPTINALTTACWEEARERALVSEQRYEQGTAAELEGVPFAVKDLLDTAGVRTTYGSALFDDHVPDHDAAAVALVRAAGGIMIGKTATHEFGWGITTAGERFGPTRNPWSPERVPGGSSGGSGAALAAGLVPLALGSDTGGSIRMPAAFCGLVGFKPTFDVVPTVGTRALAPSLDHVGPMARTPADAAALFSVLSTRGEVDADLPARVRNAEAGPAGVTRGLRIGVPANRTEVGLDPDQQAAFDHALDTFADLGARISHVPSPDPEETYACYATILLAEALAEQRRTGLLPARRDEYGSDVQRRIALAEELDAEAIEEASSRRTEIVAALDDALDRCDVLLSPVSAGPPALCAENGTVVHQGTSLPFRRLVMPNVVPQNLAGLPACVVRAGFDDTGLPIGLQITAGRGADATALIAAAAFFGATPAVQRHWPQVASPGR